MLLDAAGPQRQDKQQAPRGPHAPVTVHLQDGRGRGQVAVQQRGRVSVGVVELAAGRDTPAAHPVSVGVHVPGRLVTPTARIRSPANFLERLENAATRRPSRSIINEAASSFNGALIFVPRGSGRVSRSLRVELPRFEDPAFLRLYFLPFDRSSFINLISI